MKVSESFITSGKGVAIIALTYCFLWGSAFPGVKTGYALFGVAAGDVPAQLLFAGYRFTLAGLMVLAFAALSGKKALSVLPGNKLRLFKLGLGMTTLQYVFFYIGLANTSGVKASIINSTSVFFSVILAHFFYKYDRLNRHTVSGCLLGFAGVLIVNWGGEFEAGFKLTGEGFLLMAFFSGAAASIYGKQLSQGIDPTLMTGWQLTSGGLTLTALGLATGGWLTNFTAASSGLLAYLAFLSAAAFALQSILLKYNPVSRVSIFSFTVPLFGAVLSAVFLGDKLLEWKNLLALILVCSGVWLVTSRRR
ncbi:DMT family transporter [Deltaproteobacteria bacterium OttesenSCG-928-K17]|nr:DMT family transporter [Deltaproteobacteria bacterium OttesenSCG-928-K17]